MTKDPGAGIVRSRRRSTRRRCGARSNAKAVFIATAVFAVLPWLASCGPSASEAPGQVGAKGSGAPAQSERSPMTREEFISAADARCGDFYEDYAAFDAARPEPAEYFEGRARLFADMLSGLRDLQPPQADAAIVTAFLSDLGQGVAVAEKAAALAKQDAADSVSTAAAHLRTADPTFAAAANAMAEYGLLICGQGG